MATKVKQSRRWGRGLLLLYGVLLLASQLVWRLGTPAPPDLRGSETLQLPEALSGDPQPRQITLAYRDRGSRAAGAPTLVLLHGSPGNLQDFDQFAALLPPDFRVLVPDLPGFGKSQRHIADYSSHAHALYLESFLEQLDVQAAHLVAFSMGGAVAAEFAALAPERLASLSLVSALGTVELELFGDQDLNHLIHGAQLAGIEGLQQFFPHFGGAENWVLGKSYARNFYDTDQERVRKGFESVNAPCLIIHGREDFLVPIASARETARIVPQAELQEEDTSHFLLWTQPEKTAAQVAEFVRRVVRGVATTRAQASPARRLRATRAFDPGVVPPAIGPSLLILIALLIVGTFVSEDLTTIAAGLMVAQGRIEFVPAALACCVGVYIGDIGLFLAGRWLGRPVVERRPLSWFMTSAALERASAWFERQGIKTIFLSRFMPGLRLPTYFAAGLLRTRFASFAFYFAIAVMIWTPLLVLFSVWIGDEAQGWLEQWGLWAVLGLLLAIALLQRVVLRLFTFRGRRSLRGSWMRLTQWEFWPPWMFYPPIVLYILWLAIRHRSLALVTAVNPSMPTGGFIGEAKSKILDKLDSSEGLIARYRLIDAKLSVAERLELMRGFLATLEAPLPIVLKPEVGQRGSGVRVLKSQADLEQALSEIEVDHILQEFVPGPEFGVFYIREAGTERGRIFSITQKVIPELIGDGRHTLEELILLGPRSVAMASIYLEIHARKLQTIPQSGARIPLVELGTHCLGAIFRNGAQLCTPALEETIERMSRSYDGFHFGRYDLRAVSEAAFREGRDFKVIELNGVTSEATHIYDAQTSLFEAWRVLCEQWRLAFEIAAANRDAGAQPDSILNVWREFVAYRSGRRSHHN